MQESNNEQPIILELERMTEADVENASLYERDINNCFKAIGRLKRRNSDEIGLVLMAIAPFEIGDAEFLIRPLATLEPLPDEINEECRYERPSDDFIKYIVDQINKDRIIQNEYLKNINRG